MKNKTKTNPEKFITLEGGEGVGKSSNMLFIKQYLNDKGFDVLLTREPGGTPLAEEIRELFIKERKEKVAENTELLLVFAARAQHIAEVIRPALSQGKWVLSDRFTDATYAYQGGGRGLRKDTIEHLEILVQEDLRPSLTILLDIPVDLGLKRAKVRNELDRIEQEKTDFFERVRASYLERARAEPERFYLIDASVDLISVQQQITMALDAFLLKLKAD